MANNVDFQGSNSLSAQNGGSLSFSVHVTAQAETGNKFNLVLELLSSSCFFIGSGGKKTKKMSLSFSSKGFMQKTPCKVNVKVGSDKSGNTTTTLKAYTTDPAAPGTKNSNSPEVSLKIQDGASV